MDWLDRQPFESIWISSVTLVEIRFGRALLPDGQRETFLLARFEELVAQDLQSRSAQFDAAAANQATELAARCKAGGRPVDMRDTFNAGIALARRAMLATHNVKHQRLNIRFSSSGRSRAIRLNNTLKGSTQ